MFDSVVQSWDWTYAVASEPGDRGGIALAIFSGALHHRNPIKTLFF